MKCPKCKSENVSVDLVQVEGKTKKHGNGLGGHINNTAWTYSYMYPGYV